MTDEQIEIQRVAGDIILVLKNGTPPEKASLLRTIELSAGPAHRAILEQWAADGFPEPEN